MNQTCRMSFIETTINIGSGFFLSMAVWHWVAAPVIKNYLGGDFSSIKNNLIITTIFTVTSFLRSLACRRLFNWIHFKHVLN